MQRMRSTPSLPKLDGMMGSGLVTLEKVQVLKYGAGSGDAPV